MPYDHDHTENAEFRVREYANEFKSFSAKKKDYLFRLITSKGGGQCLPIMITPHKLNFMHKNMQMNLKDLKVKKNLSC